MSSSTSKTLHELEPDPTRVWSSEERAIKPHPHANVRPPQPPERLERFRYVWKATNRRIGPPPWRDS